MSKIHILQNRGNTSSNNTSFLNALVLESITQSRVNSWDNKIDQEKLNILTNKINEKISSINRDIEIINTSNDVNSIDINDLKNKLSDLINLVGDIENVSNSNNNYINTLIKNISQINKFIDETYSNEIININNKIDNKANSYVQEDKPHNEFSNIEESTEYNGWLGDIWRKPSTGADYKYLRKQNTDGTFNYYWELQTTSIPDDLFDKIDGKASIYFSKPTSYTKHDCWILEDDDVHSPNKMGTMLFAINSNDTYLSTDWVDLAKYVNQDDYDTEVGDIKAKYQRLADRFAWIVGDESTQSSLVITDSLIQAIASSNIQLSAKKILINGLLEGTTWRVDEEGNLEVNDLNIKGNLTCKNFSTENVVGSSIGQILDSDKEYHATDTNKITDIIDDIPYNLNGYTVRIYMDCDITDDITFRKHMNGSIKLFMCGYTLKGFIHTMFDNSMYELYGGSSESDTTVGKVMPYKGYTLNSYTYTVLLSHSPNVILKNMIIYGANNDTNNVGLGATQKTNLVMSNVTFVGCKHNCRTYSLSRIHCDSSSGLATGVGWYASTGSRISFGATTQAGGSTANTDTGNNGQILSSGVTFSTTAVSSTNTSSTENNTIRSVTYYPSYADTYRSTVYNNWKKDGVCRQGDWGYGDCNGYFFFGSQFNELKGYNITKIKITLTRKSGVGNSASCSHGIYYHTYTGRPSSIPSMTSCSKSMSLAWEETGSVEITDSTVLSGISNGTIKGFGIKSTYDKVHYSAINTCKVKIYFSENNEVEAVTQSNLVGEAIVGEAVISDNNTMSVNNTSDFSIQATVNYTPTSWLNGDVISAEKLNKIEQGIYNCSTFCNEETIKTYIDEQLNTLWESEY